MGGQLTLVVDGKQVGQGHIQHTLPRLWFTEGLDIGKDLLTPVSPDYASPFAFNGIIRTVTFDLK